MLAIKFRTFIYVNAYFDMRHDFRDSLGYRRTVACSAVSNRLKREGVGSHINDILS